MGDPVPTLHVTGGGGGEEQRWLLVLSHRSLEGELLTSRSDLEHGILDFKLETKTSCLRSRPSFVLPGESIFCKWENLEKLCP